MLFDILYMFTCFGLVMAGAKQVPVRAGTAVVPRADDWERTGQAEPGHGWQTVWAQDAGTGWAGVWFGQGRGGVSSGHSNGYQRFQCSSGMLWALCVCVCVCVHTLVHTYVCACVCFCMCRHLNFFFLLSAFPSHSWSLFVSTLSSNTKWCLSKAVNQTLTHDVMTLSLDWALNIKH